MKKKISKKKLIAVIVSVVLLTLVAGDWVLSAVIYENYFNQRFESYEPLMLYVEDFEGLRRTKYEFPSDKGQMLTGYMYSSGENQRGIVVLAHGFGGGGHNSYMDCAHYFASNGYYVFAYDVTGNDESEGDGTNGLPQGIIDLDRAITFVEQSGHFPKLPIVLFTLPDALLAQGIGIRIAANDALVVIQTLVDHIPLAHLTLVVLHDLGDMVPHDFQGFLARPVLIVLLTVGRHPLGQLRVPYQTVAANGHTILLGKAHQFVGTTEAKIVP